MTPRSPTKSMIASAPTPSVISRIVSTCLPSAATVVSAPISPASARALSDGSMTMTSAGVIAFRHWIPMWPSPPALMTTARAAGVEDARRLLHRVVGREPGVRQRGDVLRVQRRIELHDRPRGGLQQLGEPPVRRDARERVVRAVHVVAGAAGPAQATGDERVQDDRVADGHVGDRRADLVDPAGVFVPEDVGAAGRRSSRPTGPPARAGRSGTGRRRRCAR